MTREEATQVIRVEIEPLSYRQAEALDMAISALSAERVVRCKDCEYKVHCHQTVSHTKIHEDFKEYWAEPIDFCSRAKMKGDM